MAELTTQSTSTGKELLVTCAKDNVGSRRVIEANGGTLDRIVDGEAHYRLPTSQHDA
jgi:predicted acetyltransferase